MTNKLPTLDEINAATGKALEECRRQFQAAGYQPTGWRKMPADDKRAWLRDRLKDATSATEEVGKKVGIIGHVGRGVAKMAAGIAGFAGAVGAGAEAMDRLAIESEPVAKKVTPRPAKKKLPSKAEIAKMGSAEKRRYWTDKVFWSAFPPYYRHARNRRFEPATLPDPMSRQLRRQQARLDAKVDLNGKPRNVATG